MGSHRPLGPRLRARGAVSLLLAAWLLGPSSASAADVELSSQTVAQGYEVASPWEGSSIERRRLLQIVGFSLHRLQGRTDGEGGDYSLRLGMRVDADFGLGNHLPDRLRDAETRWTRASGAYFVPGLSTARLDLMYGYVEGRGLGGGWLDFRAGRQYLVDVLGWWSFDGALTRLTTPWYFDLEVYGGLEQRGGLPLSTSRFEAQGMWRGRRADFGGEGEPRTSDFPGYQEAAAAPAFGAALESSGPSWVHARLSYRRVFNTGSATTSPFDDGGTQAGQTDELRTSTDRVGGSVQLLEGSLGGLRGGLAYDLYGQLIPSAYAGLEVFLGERVTVGVDLDYVEPVFDADSIFNWFTKSPSTSGTLRGAWRIGSQVELTGSGGVRAWSTEGDPDTFGEAQCAALGLGPGCGEGADVDDATSASLQDATRSDALRSTDVLLDALAHVGGVYRGSLGRLELRGSLQSGARARQLGADLAAERSLDGGRYALGARVSVYEFSDLEDGDRPAGGRAPRDATSFAYVVGAGFRPLDGTRLSLEWEHDMNRLVGQRFRVLGSLELRWSQ